MHPYVSVTERAVYGASMSAVPQLSLNPKMVGLLKLKRTEVRAPTSRSVLGLWPHSTTAKPRDYSFKPRLRIQSAARCGHVVTPSFEGRKQYRCPPVG